MIWQVFETKKPERERERERERVGVGVGDVKCNTYTPGASKSRLHCSYLKKYPLVAHTTSCLSHPLPWPAILSTPHLLRCVIGKQWIFKMGLWVSWGSGLNGESGYKQGWLMCESGSYRREEIMCSRCVQRVRVSCPVLCKGAMPGKMVGDQMIKIAPVFNIVETYSVTIDNIPTYSSLLAQSSIQQRDRI